MESPEKDVTRSASTSPIHTVPITAVLSPRAIFSREPGTVKTIKTIRNRRRPMKRHKISITLSALLLAIILVPPSVFGQDTPSLTGAGAAAFPAGTTFSGVTVRGLTFGLGDFIYS